MSDDIAVKIENLTKIYKLYEKPIDRLKESLNVFSKKNYHKDFYALKDISFEIKKGEAIGIIGKNGSGKSTLLKIITGVLSPSSGRISIVGRISALLELGAGFNPEYTGIENIYLNGSMMGYSKSYIQSLVPEILEFADIGDFINQPVKTYSSGMFVRLAFAVSSCVKPDILIIDEALSVGDFFFVQKCYKKMEEIMKSGVSVLLVTHSMADLIKFTSKALLLEQGRCTYYGDSLIAMQKYLSNENVHKDLSINSLAKQSRNMTDWIPKGCLVDISCSNIESIGDAKCNFIGISDCNSNPSNTFKVGDTVVFYAEFEALNNIDVPICGITIIDRQGNIVHGKHAIHHGIKNLKKANRGAIIRFTIKIKLDIAPGEYSYIIGLSTMDPYHYDNINLLSHSDLMQSLKRTLHVSRVNTITVYGNNTNFAAPFNGICDLDGNCEVTIS